MKRTIPFLIAAVTGFLLIATHFVPFTQTWGEEVMRWFDIVAAFAFVLGGGSLLKMHLEKISYQRVGWGYSVVTVAAFLVTLLFGLFKFGVPPAESTPAYNWSGHYLTEGGYLWWIYEYVFLPLSATMFAMLAFYIASAAFRAFRAKNAEAIILLGVAFVVLLGQTYTGVVLTDWIPPESGYAVLRLENLTEMIKNVFVLAGNRAIMLGIALGVVATSLKVLLGVDKSYLGSE